MPLFGSADRRCRVHSSEAGLVPSRKSRQYGEITRSGLCCCRHWEYIVLKISGCPVVLVENAILEEVESKKFEGVAWRPRLSCLWGRTS